MTERTRFVQVADGVHAVLGTGGMPNAVCIDGGSDGIVVVDSRFTPRYAREMIDELRLVSGEAVRALINTHHHSDHVLGNSAIPTDRIIAHRNARLRLAEGGQGCIDTVRQRRPDLADELEGVTLRLPTETITGGLELSMGGLTIDVRHPGRTAHTDGDLVVHIPEAGVLIAADLVFNGVAPVMRDGDIDGLRLTLEELRQDRYDVVVPGHGELGGPELIDRQLGFVETVTEVTERTLDAGGSIDDAVRAAVEATGHLLFAEQRVGESVRLVAAAHQGA